MGERNVVAEAPPRPPSARPVWAFSLALALAAALVALLVEAAVDVPNRIPFLALLAAFICADLVIVRIYHEAHSHAFSLGEVVLVVGLVGARPTVMLAAQVISLLIVLGVVRRLPLVKLVFNIGCTALAEMAAAGVYQMFTDGEITHVSTWGAAAAGSAVFAAVGALAVSGVIAISRGRFRLIADVRMIAYGEASALGNAVLALIGLTLASISWVLAAFVIVPLAVLSVAYRGYINQRRRYETLDFLYQATMALHEAPNLDDGLISVLEHAREALRVQFAQAVLFTASGEAVTSIAALDPDRRVRMSPLGPDDADVCHAVLGELATTTILDRKVPSHHRLLDAMGTNTGVAVALVTEDKVAGLLLVGDRLGDISPFGPEESKLVTLLANQVNVALERGALEHSLSELIELERKLSHQAHHDPLTGLANRTLLQTRLLNALAEPDAKHAVLIIDLDDFKTVNDSLGHAAGDQLLITVASRIQGAVRAGDLTARLGGDEFAVLLNHVGSSTTAAALAGKIVDELRRPVWIEGREVAVRASIGIALTDASHTSVGDVLREADMAMYRAKGAGKGRFALYESSMHGEVSRRLALSAALARAVDQGELTLAYQPIMDLVSGATYGLEALVRWYQNDGTTIGPSDFIPLAEQTGLILPIGSFVLDAATRQLAQWQRDLPGTKDIMMTVNISARQLVEPGFVDEVRAVVSRNGVNPRNLVLELTESVLIEDTPDVARTLLALKAIGVRLAIDDFGTGYSSMNYVSRFPMDVLKIDRSFVEAVAENSTSTALVAAMVQLANSLGVTAVAEGVENAAQADALRRLGCRIGQGYLFSRPCPAAEIELLFGLDGGLGPMPSVPPQDHVEA